MRRNCRRAVKSQVSLNLFFFDDDDDDDDDDDADDDDDDDDDDVKFLLCLKLFSILLLQFPDMLAMFKMIFPSCVFYTFLNAQAMFWFIILLVFLNTCVLGTEHYRQPQWLNHFQVGKKNHLPQPKG